MLVTPIIRRILSLSWMKILVNMYPTRTNGNEEIIKFTSKKEFLSISGLSKSFKENTNPFIVLM